MQQFGKLTLALISLGATLTYTAYRLATVLCLYANSDGKCWPSLKTLLEKVSCNRNSLQNARNELAEFGLKWKKRPNKSTVYEWNLLKMEVSCRIPPAENGGIVQDTMEVSCRIPPINEDHTNEQNMCKCKTVKILTRDWHGKNNGTGTGSVFFKNSGETDPEKWTDDCTPTETTARIKAFARGERFEPSPGQLREWNRMRTPAEVTAEIRHAHRNINPEPKQTPYFSPGLGRGQNHDRQRA